VGFGGLLLFCGEVLGGVVMGMRVAGCGMAYTLLCFQGDLFLLPRGRGCWVQSSFSLAP
jgi:hypothetical protein